MAAQLTFEGLEPTEEQILSALFKFRWGNPKRYATDSDPASYLIVSAINKIENEMAVRGGFFYGSKLFSGSFQRFRRLTDDAPRHTSLPLVMSNIYEIGMVQAELLEVMDGIKKRARDNGKKLGIYRMQRKQILDFRCGEHLLRSVTPPLVKLQEHFDQVSHYTKPGAWSATASRGFSLRKYVPELAQARDEAFFQPSLETLNAYRSLTEKLELNLQIREVFEGAIFTDLDDWRQYLERGQEIIDELDVAAMIEEVG